MCNNPTPRLGGRTCDGKNVEISQCSPQECDGSCPENSKFSECVSCQNTCAALGKVWTRYFSNKTANSFKINFWIVC